MKNITKVILFFLLCTSCYNDDDFEDLSRNEDYLMIVTIYFDSQKINESSGVEIIDYLTNGFGQLTSHSTTHFGVISGDKDSITDYYAVKDYKTVGVKIIPIENVVSYQFEIVRTTDSPFTPDIVVHTKKTSFDKETSIFYDFETEKLTIN